MPALLYIAIMLLLTLLQGMLFFAWDNSRGGRAVFEGYMDTAGHNMYEAYVTREWFAAILMLVVVVTMGYLTYWMFF